MATEKISYYSCAPGVSLETEADGHQIVKFGAGSHTLDEMGRRIVDILIRMPDSTEYEIQSSYVIMSGQPVSRTDISGVLSGLRAAGIVKRDTRAPRMNMPFPVDHKCEMCGCSCMAQLVGPLNDEEHENVCDAHRQLAADGAMDAALNPIMKGLKPDGSCLHFVHFPEKRCAFLGDDNLCRIHDRFGALKKPAACRRFPLIAVATESEIRIGIKPYCYANMRVCDMEHAKPGYLAQYRAAHTSEFNDLVENASFRAVLRVQDEDELLQARVQEAQILSWLSEPLPYAALLASLIRGSQSDMAELPKPFVQEVQRSFKELASALAPEVEKLGATKHADHARELLRVLAQPISRFDALSPDAAFGRYVRYALYETVFLRETTRFPAVSLGAFACALGALAAAQEPDHADTHFTAWMRLLSQTQAFTMLFPSPQAMAAITRHLL